MGRDCLTVKGGLPFIVLPRVVHVLVRVSMLVSVSVSEDGHDVTFLAIHARAWHLWLQYH